jgi:hypothetical protein
MAAYWPTSTSEYAAPMNEIPTVVFSRTLEDAGWAETREAHASTTGTAIHVYRPRTSAATTTAED